MEEIRSILQNALQRIDSISNVPTNSTDTRTIVTTMHASAAASEQTAAGFAPVGPRPSASSGSKANTNATTSSFLSRVSIT
eukprot:gene5737-10991_t